MGRGSAKSVPSAAYQALPDVEAIADYIIPHPVTSTIRHTPCPKCIPPMLTNPFAECHDKTAARGETCVGCKKRKSRCIESSTMYREELDKLMEAAAKLRKATVSGKTKPAIDKLYAAWLRAVAEVRPLYLMFDAPAKPKETTTASTPPKDRDGAKKRKATADMATPEPSPSRPRLDNGPSSAVQRKVDVLENKVGSLEARVTELEGIVNALAQGHARADHEADHEAEGECESGGEDNLGEDSSDDEAGSE